MSDHKTFCTVCEAVCGMIATVENDRVVEREAALAALAPGLEA